MIRKILYYIGVYFQRRVKRRLLILCVIILCCVVLFTGCSKRNAGIKQTYSDIITGRIVDPMSSGLKDAVVVILGTFLTTTTDSDGKYTIANVPTGIQTITATLNNYHSNSIELNILKEEKCC